MNNTYPYPYSAAEARKRNELSLWRESHKANIACRNAIEEAIRQNFDGMHLDKNCITPVLEEYGPGTAGVAYGAVSILSLLLVPDRETALVYVFFGWYPILRPRIAALPSLPVRLVCRLGVCGLSMFLLYGVTIRLLGLTAVTEELGSGYFTAALAVLGCGVFLLLDLALGRLTFLWRQKLRRQFFRKS